MHPSHTGYFGISIIEDYGTDLDASFQVATSLGSATPIGLEGSPSFSGYDVSADVLSNNQPITALTIDDLSGNTLVRVRSFDTSNLPQLNFDIDFAGNPGEVRDPSVVAFDGGFAVAFEARPFSFIPSTDIFVQIYDNAGNLTGGENVSNPSLSLSFQDDGSNDRDPHLAIAPDGNIIVTWTSDAGGVEDQEIALVNVNNLPSAQVGFDLQDNNQRDGVVAFFGVGNIAAFHYDETLNMIVGERFTGERDSAGDEGNNLIEGDDFFDLLNGVEGNDTLYGRRNDDTLQGGDGNDWLYGGEGDDELYGEEGVGAFGAGPHRDRLLGEDGNDTLYGEDDRDTLNGGEGHDFLDGGDGRDVLQGKSGNDTMFGGAGGDIMNGANGEDSMDGGDNGDLMDGGNQNDTMFGGKGLDTLFGNTGNDVMDGGFQNDTLNGGTGNDTLTGGPGFDQFVFNTALASNNVDTITDFDTGEDLIVLNPGLFSSITGVVSASNLRFGNKALDSDDFLMYNSSTGLLRYDEDANGPIKPIIFAQLTPGTVLDEFDFGFFVV